MAQETLRLVCLPVSAHDGRLPRQYTLEGQGAKKDISPSLEWYRVPGGTRSLALVVQDIDADERVPWMHWVVANKSPEEKGLPEGSNPRWGCASAAPDQIEAVGVGGRGAAGWCRLMLKCTAMEQNQHMWWCRLMLKCTTMEQIRWVVVTSNFSRTVATSLAVLIGSGVALFFRRSSIALAYNESADPIDREFMSSHFSFFSTLLSL
ncbi:cold-regulated protein [Hordeum vulgare]|nr:cold-regulated protein [Hordeum vulgare]